MGMMMGIRGLTRRKQVDSDNLKINQGHQQLAKRLTLIDLIGIGVGSTIGAGVYVLIGTVAREDTGPALAVAFLVAGVAAALSAFCYAELSGRCPSAGSAYHYSYICIGEGVAWVIGWGLILEYAIGGSVVARGVSPNLALYFGGEDHLPAFLVRHSLFGVVVDPCAAALVIIATILSCIGIKESVLTQTIVTSVNICALCFVIVAGGYLGFRKGWVGYELSSGYFPYGVNGLLAGSATVFFSYIGFDAVTAAAEEVKNPRKDLPLGIGISLSLSCALYMLVSVVIVGLVPYYNLNKDTPISSAFSDYGLHWAAFIITTGAVMALLATLMGSLLPQARILLTMARDGLLPSFFSDIDRRTLVPVKGTIVTGILAAGLAFFMDVSELAGMVSVGTLLAFTAVAVSVLIVRYLPPNEVPVQASSQDTSFSISGHGHIYGGLEDDIAKGPFTLSEDDQLGLLSDLDPHHRTPVNKEAFLRKHPDLLRLIVLFNSEFAVPMSMFFPLLLNPQFTCHVVSGVLSKLRKYPSVYNWAEKRGTMIEQVIRINFLYSHTYPRTQELNEESHIAAVKYLFSSGPDSLNLLENVVKQKGQRSRNLAALFLVIILIGVLLLASAASVKSLPSSSRITLCGIGAVIFLVGTIGLSFIDEDGASARFGYSGGFTCPLVPFLPATSILINAYLLMNISGSTWIRISIWFLIGVLVYLFYGRTHSSLLHATYVPITHTEDVYSSSSNHP